MTRLFLALIIPFLTVCCTTAQEKAIGKVERVEVKGKSGQYSFYVTLKTPDTGCEQYADWWEVLDKEGKLIYRRILLHSHVDEQPFTRSGGTVNISSDMEVYVRLHMNNTGYSTEAMEGTAANGFKSTKLKDGFAINLENSDPLPEGCRF